jgi:GDP-L-fucose synthase
MCHAYNRQHATKYLCAMPTNLYGPGDNFDLQTSHVLPAMIRKFHDAKTSGGPVVLWGSGSPRREFLHVDDLADACLHLMSLPSERLATIFSQDAPPLVNIGCGEDLTIRNLATLVAKAVGYDGEVSWDRSKPDGTPRKLLDTSRLNGLGWKPRIALSAGIRDAYRWFQSREGAPKSQTA